MKEFFHLSLKLENLLRGLPGWNGTLQGEIAADPATAIGGVLRRFAVEAYGYSATAEQLAGNFEDFAGHNLQWVMEHDGAWLNSLVEELETMVKLYWKENGR